MQIEFLTLHTVLQIHHHQLRVYGGSPGIRDQGLLISAIAQPSATFEDRYLHHDLFEMAAAYLFHLAQNHPFVDGNKRVAIASALVFLRLHQIKLTAEPESLEKLVFSVSKGESSKSQIAAFFRKNSKS